MAFITKEYYQFLESNNLIERHDNTKLAEMSAKAGVKDGKGLNRKTFERIMRNGHTCTDEVLELIRNYYEPKIELIKQQNEAVKKMKRKLEVA